MAGIRRSNRIEDRTVQLGLRADCAQYATGAASYFEAAPIFCDALVTRMSPQVIARSPE